MKNTLENQKAVDYIASECFTYLKGLSVVELGPSHGKFTEYLTNYSNQILCIDGDSSVVEHIRNQNHDNVSVIEGDFHDMIRTVGKYNAVVLYGVLYHSHAPIMLLEDVVNYIEPEIILIEALHAVDCCGHSFEESNKTGNRFSKNKKLSNLTFNVGFPVQRKVLENMDYTCIKEIQCPHGSTEFKKNFIYGVFKKK